MRQSLLKRQTQSGLHSIALAKSISIATTLPRGALTYVAPGACDVTRIFVGTLPGGARCDPGKLQ